MTSISNPVSMLTSTKHYQGGHGPKTGLSSWTLVLLLPAAWPLPVFLLLNRAWFCTCGCSRPLQENNLVFCVPIKNTFKKCVTQNIQIGILVAVCGFLKQPWQRYRFCNLYIKYARYNPKVDDHDDDDDYDGVDDDDRDDVNRKGWRSGGGNCPHPVQGHVTHIWSLFSGPSKEDKESHDSRGSPAD